MSLPSKREYFTTIHGRYQRAGRAQKPHSGRVLRHLRLSPQNGLRLKTARAQAAPAQAGSKADL